MVEEPGDGSVMSRKLRIGGSRGGATSREIAGLRPRDGQRSVVKDPPCDG